MTINETGYNIWLSWESQIRKFRVLIFFCKKQNFTDMYNITGKPGMLQSMGLQRVGHSWATEQKQQHYYG